MHINILMLNIKNIFITTGISILFGVYSIYNILEYLRITNYYRLREINNLYKLIHQTNKKYIALNDEYNQLYQKYNDLVTEVGHSKKEIIELNIKIIEIENFNDYIFNLINSESNQNINEKTVIDFNSNIQENTEFGIEGNTSINNTTLKNDIYDKLRKLNIHLPKLPRSETITSNFDPIVKQKFNYNHNLLINTDSNSDLDLNSDSNDFDYHYVDNKLITDEIICSANNSRTSSRCSSLTNDNDINETPKRLFFGLF